MKYYIIILSVLLLNCSFCFAQKSKKDSLMELLSRSNGLTYSTYPLGEIGNATVTSMKVTSIKNDTARCIMLVCDTTHYKKEDGWIVGSMDVHWQFGYRIFKISSDRLYVDTEYLSENKKPLSKNIVVWLTK